MNVEDAELRQAISVAESYKQRVEALSRQVQVLRVSLDEVTLASNALKAFRDAKDGDEIMVPIGATSYITVKVTSNRNVVVDVGSDISVEKDANSAIEYMDANNAEISEALTKTMEALNESQNALNNLTAAIQQEYNKVHNITPRTVKKAVRDVFDIVAESSRDSSSKGKSKGSKGGIDPARLINDGVSGGTEEENNNLIDKLTVEMTKAAKDLDFERAAEIRDIIIELKGKK